MTADRSKAAVRNRRGTPFLKKRGSSPDLSSPKNYDLPSLPDARRPGEDGRIKFFGDEGSGEEPVF
jgi:hypothetical protein